MGDYYIGLISGTSMDGIDAALVNIQERSIDVVRTREHSYPDELRRQLMQTIREPRNCALDDLGRLDRWVGECFSDAAAALLEDAAVDASAVNAIGSHGQTIRHQPDAPRPFTLQIGDPTIIANGTGIVTVADFRRADIALGGQGAPLTPLFHEWLFRQTGLNRIVLNIGGIANVTILRGDAADTTGFDTGPGNTLLDAWVGKHCGEPFDRDGSWAAQGILNEELLSRLSADAYFSTAPPKSTGFEYFNLEWLQAAGVEELEPADVQATLCTLTADTIATAIRSSLADGSDVLVCGGGVHNLELMRRLRAALPAISIESTASVGLDPDWVEAAAFAWLAMRTVHRLPGNLPSVTGASRSTVLGAIHNVAS
jgi:anhydro-N-acetylmuramic acid kinase